MCGIVGFITNETEQGAQVRRAYSELALVLDSIRGDDSTGVFFLEHKPTTDAPPVIKTDADGYAFVNTPEYMAYMEDVSAYRAVVGHNRAATRGGISPAAAHPFQEGAITLVHNGTIQTGSLPIKFEKKLATTVDSHLLTYNLSQKPYKEVLEAIDGAFALVWHDSRDDAIRVSRNGERPLHFVRSLEQDTIFFASEAQMLTLLMDNLMHRCTDIMQPEVGELFTFHKGQKQPTKEVLTLRPKVQAYSPNQSWGNRHNGTRNSYSGESSGGSRSFSSSATINNRGKYKIGYENYKQVPAPLAQYLRQETDYSCYKYYPFTPLNSINLHCHSGQTPIWSSVLGRIGTDLVNHEALIIKHIIHKYDKEKDNEWTVQPIGMKYRVDEATGERIPVIICREVLYTVHQEAREWGVAEDRKVVAKQEVKEKAKHVGEFVTGPYSVKIPVTEYLDLTRDGCGFCRQQITIPEADRLFWLEGEAHTPGLEPICEGCAGSVVMGADGIVSEGRLNILEIKEIH